MFSLFANKRELFLAAVERGFDRVLEVFEAAAASWRAGESADECEDALGAMDHAYVELLHSDRDYLLLQHQALSEAGPDRVDEFFRKGMSLNVAAALGVEDISVTCSWGPGRARVGLKCFSRSRRPGSRAR